MISQVILLQFLNCHSFKDVPIILETPKKRESDDLRNLKKVRRMLN